MKDLKLHWSARPLGVLLSALMLLPILALYVFGAPQARAQGLSATQPQWAVLDFANPSGYGGADVGRLAADSFVVELAKINRYTVIPRQDVLNGIQANNLTAPLNLSSILRLGQSLGVNAVVAGEVGSISFSRDRRQAKVTLIVRVIDPRSGFLLNGALAEGYSNLRPIPVTDDEQLVNEAFGNAAFNAVRQISKFNLPVATVLIGRDTQSVTLNKGTRDGLYNNLDMLVTRNGVVTGRVRVSDATNNEANATITDLGSGIRPEDRATAIYHLPPYTIDRSVGTIKTVSGTDVAIDTPSTGTHRSAFSGIGGILVAIFSAGLLLLAVKAGHNGGDNSLGGAGISSLQAVAGRAQDLGGSLTSIPIGSTVSIPSYIPVAVRITSNIGNINPTYFLEFHVYRSDSPPVLTNPFSLGVTPTFTTSTGGSNTNNGTNTGTTGTGTGGTLGLAGFGSIPLLTQAGHGSLTVFDDLTNKVSVTASKPDPEDSSTLDTLTIQTLLNTTTGINVGCPEPDFSSDSASPTPLKASTSSPVRSARARSTQAPTPAAITRPIPTTTTITTITTRPATIRPTRQPTRVAPTRPGRRDTPRRSSSPACVVHQHGHLHRAGPSRRQRRVRDGRFQRQRDRPRHTRRGRLRAADQCDRCQPPVELPPVRRSPRRLRLLGLADDAHGGRPGRLQQRQPDDRLPRRHRLLLRDRGA